MKDKYSKTGQLDKTDIKSLLHYFLITIAGATVAVLPQIQTLLESHWLEPALVGFIVAFLGIVLKKLLQNNDNDDEII